MDEFTLRRALESDSKPIDKLIHLVDINPSGLDWKRFVVVENRAGEIIACGQIKPHGADVNEMASIAVHPDYRGQGLARRVIDNLLANAGRPMYLMCLSHNGPLYEKFGFRALQLDEMPRYFRRIRKVFDAANLLLRWDEGMLIMKLD